MEKEALERELEKLRKGKSPFALGDAIERAKLISPALDMRLPRLENIKPIELPNIPTQEQVNSYQSAAALLKRLASSIAEWRKQLPDDVQPAVLALLHGGVQVSVDSLAQESFHGIRIEGMMNGAACVVLAHQATIQLICFAQMISPPEVPKRPIGFVIEGESVEA